MHVFSYDPETARRPIIVDGEAVCGGFDLGGAWSKFEPETGLPCIVDDDGIRVEPFDRFFRYLRSDGVSLRSVQSYARDLAVFARYLRDARGKSMLEAILIKNLSQAFAWIGGSSIGGSIFMLLVGHPTDWRWAWGLPVGLGVGALALWLVPYFSGKVPD